MLNIDFELLTDKDMSAIAKRQIKELEAQLFAFILLEPSKLQDAKNHLAWEQNKLQLINQLDRIKKNLHKHGVVVSFSVGEEE